MPFYYTDVQVPTRDAPPGRQAWARAWCPPGWDSQVSAADAKWILLARATPAALVWLRTPYTHPDLRLLADDKAERLSGATRVRLGNIVTDRTIDGTKSFADTIANFFMVPTPNPDGPWGQPLRPHMGRGRYEIRLGPPEDTLFWSAPGPLRTTHTVTLTDNFNRAGNLDGSTASGGGTWDLLEGDNWATVTLCTQSSVILSFHTAWITTNFDTDDHYAQLDMVTMSGAGTQAIGVGVRIQGASGTQGYGLEVDEGGAARLYRWDTDANLDTGTVTLSLPDTLYLSFDGSAYDCRFNGTTITGMSGTNTLFTGHLRACISGYSSSNSTVVAIDNYAAADLAAPPAATTKTLAALGVG